ncbi:MAG TPA: deiodinase-like protein [Tepidisphaeraceae bacterium]|jgi:Spy/CpxP family protein refolding chaperone/peroxiredoxin
MFKIKRPWLLSLFAAAVVAAGFPDSSQAQNPDGEKRRGQDKQADAPRDGRRPDRQGPARPQEAITRLQRAVDQLDLSAEQKEKLQAVREEAREKLQDMREEVRDLSPEERRTRVAETLKEIRESSEAVLTPEQRTKLKTLLAAEGPATRPARGQGPMVDRLRDALNEADLTDEQKPKVDAILDAAAKAFAKLREEAEGNMASLREQGRELAEETRSKLAEVLTSEQRKALREAMRPDRGGPGEGPRGGDPDGERPRDKRPPPPDAPEPGAANEQQQNNAASAKAGVVSSTGPAVLTIGAPAPSFSLRRIDGKNVTLQSLAGRPAVIVFGSLTSATFRSKIAGFDTLKRDYRAQASVLMIYTREAHAADEWNVERNRDQQINIAAPATLEERTELAKRMRESLNVTLDVLVDDVDNAVSTAYNAWPNGCVVLDANGNAVAHQKWADADGVKVILDRVLRK